MTDRIIGHYRILEKIGSGAMGEVFRARDERLGRDVALKMIRPASSENPDHLRRFELEARAAAALNHPNIVAIYDVGFFDGSPYIVCELLKGKTLRKRVDEGALPLPLVIDYTSQIVQGLIAAHDHRIVHRDLKPENLFVTTDGRVKILDFGVAKLQSAPEESGRSVEQMTTVTKSGTVVGTYAYMSPEQLRGKAVDHRSDIFSVGAILYEMLTGERAFRGETEVDTMTAVLLENPPQINLEQASVPLSFQQILGHCLEKEAENRFQSARDLAFALDTLANPSGPVRLKSPRSRAQLIPWAVAGLLLVATLLLLGNQLQQRSIQAPSYRRLTYEAGTVYSARFAPDFRSIVYGAAWNGRPLQLFSTVGNSLLAQPLNVADANLLAMSRTGELAVVLHGAHRAHLETQGGMLARAPLAGGSPREILEDVPWADWDANGELAVVHYDRAQGCDRIEYPIGHSLYQSKGWISHLRVSPRGDKIAFMDHPSLWDDRGVVSLIDLKGHLTVLSTEWESEDGLAWSPDGREIWFTAAEKGLNRELMAVNLSGRLRKILAVPGGMTLEDVAPDGRALVSVVTERIALATATQDGKAVDISWRDWTIAKDISRDGQSIFFEDASEAAGTHYSLGIRRLDGTPPVLLGEGSSGTVSPDGKWAISVPTDSPGQVKLVPTGPGQPRTIAIPGLDVDNGNIHFLGDGKRITFIAKEPGHGVRTYLMDLEGGKPIPITPEGITSGLVSPDGQYIVRGEDAAGIGVYPTAGGTPRLIPELEREFTPIQWSEDNSSVYGYIRGQNPSKVYKVNLATGKKTLIRELQPETTVGVVFIAPVAMTRDGSRFAYSYYQVLSVLYLISGLR
jgi:serine/threonine protein kinase/Tol biopolymer transport system component